MKKTKRIVISILLTVMMLLSSMPVYAVATGTNVTDAPGLVAAVANGDEVVNVQGFLSIYQTVHVTSDLTLNFKTDPNNPYSGAGISFGRSGEPGADPITAGFKIAPGATLTINVHDSNDQIGISGVDGALFLLEADSQNAAKLIIADGQLMAQDSTYQVSANCVMFQSTASAGAVKPSILIKNGIFRNGYFSNGSIDFTVEAGEFKDDPTTYITNSSYVMHIQNEWENKYEVVKLATEYSESFKKHLDAAGNFVIKRYHPSIDNDYDRMFMEFDSMFEEYTDDSYTAYRFEDYNKENDTALVGRFYWNDNGENTIEYHLMKLKFVYDATLKTDIDKIVEKVTGDNPNEMKWYPVSDLELVNYWLADSKGEANGTAFLMFSSEFKKNFDYKNYGFYLSSRLGNDAVFETAEGGEGLFMYDGVVYGSTSIGAEADHVLYVPTETEDTVSAKRIAVQKKLDEFLGEGKITVKETTVWEAILYKFWRNDKEFILTEYPNATFEQFKNAELPGMYPAYVHPDDPDYDAQIQADSGLDGVTGTTPCYYVTLGSKNYYFMIERNSEKIVDAPLYQSVDALTNVSVTTDSSEVPLDALVKAEKMESGAEYERIINTLGVGENATYDITLYSETASEYITKLDNGKFQVKLPVPAELEGKNLVVYYVDATNKITEHEVTVEGGFATFVTDHFSIYTLAVKTANAGNIQSPQTGDASNVYLWFMLMLVCFMSVVIAMIKSFKSPRS